MNYKAITILTLLAILSTALSAQQKAPALDKHGKLGVKCNDCHGTNTRATTISNDKCLTCHGGSYAALVKASTKNYSLKQGITNPHASHTGEVRCTRCHKNHAASTLYCNDCHSPQFNLQTP